MFKPFLAISTCLCCFTAAMATNVITTDSVTMGKSYANDVYFDLDGGTTKEVSRTNWDIAFTSLIRGAAIIANNANGVEVMVYPKAPISGWSKVDTTGCYKWPRLYNSETNWDLGAFNVNTTDKSQLDYGWGVYNMTTHDVVGDSIFLIKTSIGMKKLVVSRKRSVENRIEFYYANLDGSDSTFVNLKANEYPNRNFVYYDLNKKLIVDREMDADKWDLLFTKYMSYMPAGPGVFMWYPVTGVLINPKSSVAKYHSATLNRVTFDALKTTDLSSNINTIGYDWKVLNNTTYTYQTPDTSVYFVKTGAGNIHKLFFTGFAGSSTGKVFFAHKTLISTALPEAKVKKSRIYPIPASSAITVETQAGKVLVSLFNMTGNKVYESIETSGFFTVDVSSLTSGSYVLKLESANGVEVKQISVNR